MYDVWNSGSGYVLLSYMCLRSVTAGMQTGALHSKLTSYTVQTMAGYVIFQVSAAMISQVERAGFWQLLEMYLDTVNSGEVAVSIFSRFRLLL
jgi:hypothetical protein